MIKFKSLDLDWNSNCKFEHEPYEHALHTVYLIDLNAFWFQQRLKFISSSWISCTEIELRSLKNNWKRFHYLNFDRFHQHQKFIFNLNENDPWDWNVNSIKIVQSTKFINNVKHFGEYFQLCFHTFHIESLIIHTLNGLNFCKW